MYASYIIMFFFFFNDTATTEIYTLSLHDALPISRACSSAGRVLPAPGAAEIRNGPSDHARIATSARSCHARSDVAGWRLDRGTDAAWCKPRRTDRARATP